MSELERCVRHLVMEIVSRYTGPNLEDLVQAGWVGVAIALPRWNIRRSHFTQFAAHWIRGLAGQEFKKWARNPAGGRRTGCVTTSDDESESEARSYTDDGDGAEEIEQAAAVIFAQRALLRLKPAEQQLLFMRGVQELKLRDVGAQLHPPISHEGVRVRVVALEQKLKRKFGRPIIGIGPGRGKVA